MRKSGLHLRAGDLASSTASIVRVSHAPLIFGLLCVGFFFSFRKRRLRTRLYHRRVNMQTSGDPTSRDTEQRVLPGDRRWVSLDSDWPSALGFQLKVILRCLTAALHEDQRSSGEEPREGPQSDASADH